MRNITLKIDDETYRKARIRAATLGTSVSGLVREYLVSLESGESDREAERVAALEEIYRLTDARAAKAPAARRKLKPLTREEIHAGRLR